MNPPIDIKYFIPLTGGGVAHKVKIHSHTGHFSCWFTSEK